MYSSVVKCTVPKTLTTAETSGICFAENRKKLAPVMMRSVTIVQSMNNYCEAECLELIRKTSTRVAGGRTDFPKD